MPALRQAQGRPEHSRGAVSNRDVRRVQVAYPQIYFACHMRHVRRASTATQLSATDSTLLAHLDEDDAVRPTALARHLMQASSVLESTRVKRMLKRLNAVERQRALEGLALLAKAARATQGDRE